jgi:hypothetical protein
MPNSCGLDEVVNVTKGRVGLRSAGDNQATAIPACEANTPCVPPPSSRKKFYSTRRWLSICCEYM